MKKKMIFIFLVLCSLVIFWSILDQSENQDHSVAPKQSQSKNSHQTLQANQPIDEAAFMAEDQIRALESLDVSPKELPTNHHKHKLQKGLVAQKEQRPSHAVPFKNYNGMAIAYGDILLGYLQEDLPSGFTSIPVVDYWPSSTIPYHIQPNVSHPERVLQALAYLSEKTILEFIPVENERQDAIVFEHIDKHCLSYVGRISGTQPIFISPGCKTEHIVHEVLHAIGFLHEHSRPDRDNYIQIHWSHIQGEYHSQFEIMPDILIKEWLKFPYDVHSIMHYESQVFGRNKNTPSLTKKDGGLIPEPYGLSTMDVEKIHSLFR